MRDKLSYRSYRTDCSGYVAERSVDKRLDKEVQQEQQAHRKKAHDNFNESRNVMLNLHGLFFKITDPLKRKKSIEKNGRVILKYVGQYVDSLNNYVVFVSRVPEQLSCDKVAKEFPYFSNAIKQAFQELEIRKLVQRQHQARLDNRCY